MMAVARHGFYDLSVLIVVQDCLRIRVSRLKCGSRVKF